MQIQEILEGKKIIEFLVEKGFQIEKDYCDSDFKQGIYFKIDKRKLLVLYEVFEEDKIKETKDHFLIDRGLSYCIIKFNTKLIFYRSFGENKHFIYSERTKGNPSKIDRLNKIDKEGFDFIFQAGKDISGQFYESFRIKRNLLASSIANEVKPTEKYLIAQKIFDRFFFIYFLCHKGIVKIDKEKKISGKNLFELLLKNGDFIENIKKIFKQFNLLESEVLKIGDYEISIPYLNGGLFRPDVLEQNLTINLNQDKWEEIFEFLNSYHWIIEDLKMDEDNEDRVLTPEILGHVYERSVVEWEQKGFEEEAEEAVKKTTERKKMGVYYTPEPITDYISNNTIIPYLLKRLDGKYDSYEDLVESNDVKSFEDSIKILNEIKIVDPACGSGAFLVKSSEILFGLKRRFFYLLGNKKNFYDLKLDIITDNIYGVDILTGAIEISKLRLWLWLISDYKESMDQIKALPNIEYNLKVGNSLVGWLKENISQMSINTTFNDKIEGIFFGLIAFANSENKKEIEKARDYLIRGYKLDDYIEAYYILYKIYRRAHGKNSEDLRIILETVRQSIYSTISPTFLRYVNSKIKPKYSPSKPPITKEQLEELQVFHWSIDFGHIIKNGGFDIVLGNPPYFNIQSIEKKQYKLILSAIYAEIHSGENDISYYFYHRSYNLLKENGWHGFISSRYFIEAKFALKFRLFLKNSFNFIKLIDFGSEVKIFRESKGKEVTIHTIIFILIKNNNISAPFRFISIKQWIDNNKDVETIFDYFKKYDDMNFFDFILESYSLAQDKLENNRWLLCNARNNKLILKLENNSTSFGDFDEKSNGIFHVCKSIESGLDRIKNKEGEYEGVYRLSEEEISTKKIEKEVLYNLLKTTNVRKYLIEPNKEYFIYLTEDINPNDVPNTIKHLEKYKNLLEKRYDIQKSKKPWYVLSNTRNKEKFEEKIDKIIWPMVAPENRFALLEKEPEKKYVFSADIYYAIPKNESYNVKFILALLNSRLMNYYHSIISKKTNWGFSYSAQYVVQYPIKNIPKEKQTRFIDLVDKILEITKTQDYLENIEKQTKVIEIESAIDRLVYELYGLTDEEIQIVENYSNKLPEEP